MRRTTLQGSGWAVLCSSCTFNSYAVLRKTWVAHTLILQTLKMDQQAHYSRISRPSSGQGGSTADLQESTGFRTGLVVGVATSQQES